MRGAAEPQQAPPPPSPPPRGPDGMVLRMRHSSRVRVGQALGWAVPAVFLAAAAIVFVASSLVGRGGDPGPLPANVYDALPAAITDRFSGTQLFAMAFALIGLYVLASALRRRVASGRAELTIDASGELVQRDTRTRRLHLSQLIAVDAVENRSVLRTYRQTTFGGRQEKVTPVGSWTLLRLTDQTGTTLTLNPGLWEDSQQLAEIVRHAVWQSDVPVTPAAARAYGLPQRDRR